MGFTAKPTHNMSPTPTPSWRYPRATMTTHNALYNGARPTRGVIGVKIEMKPLCLMCCYDPLAFCTARFCSCIAHGRIAEAIGRDYETECCVYACLNDNPCAAAWYHTNVAIELRGQHGIPAEKDTLCIQHWCCQTAALAQELNFIKQLKAAGVIHRPARQ